MNCKQLTAKLLGRFYNSVFNQSVFYAKLTQKWFTIKINQNFFHVKNNQSQYGIKFCVRYRPLGLIEWILARGWWNDDGIWTEDGIFNDGNV